jgi:hypothetical protein
MHEWPHRPLLPVIPGVFHPGRRPLLPAALGVVRPVAVDIAAALSILAALDAVRPARCTLLPPILTVVRPAALNIIATLLIPAGKDKQPGQRCSYGTRLEITFFWSPIFKGWDTHLASLLSNLGHFGWR